VQVPSRRSRPGWPSAPRRRDLGAVGPPSGWSPPRGCPDAGQAGRCPVRLVRSAVGMSVQPVERTSNVQASGVQASGHPGVRTDTPLVSAALPPRCPGRAGLWSGSVGRATPVGRSGSTCPVVGGRRGRLPSSGRTGSDGAAVAGAGSPEGRPWPRAAAWPASRRRRRLGPGGPTRGWSRPGCRPGRGAWEGAGAHRPRQGVLGGLVGVVPTMGLDQQLVTTLGGRWARVVRWRPVGKPPFGGAAAPDSIRSLNR
jgi:hypothetical protein